MDPSPDPLAAAGADEATDAAETTGAPDAPDTDDRAAARVDPATLARLRSGDRAALQGALRPLLPPLLSLARRLTRDPHAAEDLVQETLLRACRGIHGFRGDASLRTWLFQIQVRLAGSPARFGARSPATDPLDLQVPDSLDTRPETGTRERELAERLDEAMERLTTRQRTALHLRAVEGLDYRTVARILGGSTAAARMLVLAARRQVMRRMGRHLAP